MKNPESYYCVKKMKKEHYLTDENRVEKISEWKAILSNYYSKKKKFKFSFEKTALLVVDMQEYFLNAESHAFIPSSRTIIKPILEVIKAFQKKQNVIFFTQHGFEPEKDNHRNMMKRWWKRSLSIEDPMFAISPELNADSNSIYTKTGYDVFGETNIGSVLDRMGYSKLVITGVATHFCCESIARQAFDYGYEVYLPIDCMASYTEEFHLNTLKAASHGFGIPITSEEILEKAK